MEIRGTKSFAPLSESTPDNAPICKELMLVRQLFVNNSYAGFHENVANSLGAGTRTWFLHEAFVCFTKALYEYNVRPWVT
jgi:hypothetical protein